jgi:hypothetical protein
VLAGNFVRWSMATKYSGARGFSHFVGAVFRAGARKLLSGQRLHLVGAAGAPVFLCRILPFCRPRFADLARIAGSDAILVRQKPPPFCAQSAFAWLQKVSRTRREQADTPRHGGSAEPRRVVGAYRRYRVVKERLRPECGGFGAVHAIAAAERRVAGNRARFTLAKGGGTNSRKKS